MAEAEIREMSFQDGGRNFNKSKLLLKTGKPIKMDSSTETSERNVVL
jgi:hypothetical protein